MDRHGSRKEKTEMIERLKYWLFQRGKDCYHCCLRCEYFRYLPLGRDNGKDSGAGADSRTAGSRGGKKERKHGAAVSNLQICGV